MSAHFTVFMLTWHWWFFFGWQWLLPQAAPLNKFRWPLEFQGMTLKLLFVNLSFLREALSRKTCILGDSCVTEYSFQHVSAGCWCGPSAVHWNTPPQHECQPEPGRREHRIHKAAAFQTPGQSPRNGSFTDEHERFGHQS